MMTPFSLDQYVILALVFLLGILIGMFAMAGGRWKRAYQEQVRENDALRAEIEQLRSEAREMESLRHAAIKTPGRDPTTGNPL
jgi:cell division protein FtsB